MDILIFGTSYVDTPERQWLVEQWAQVNQKQNPDCALLIVDSASPNPLPKDVEVYQLGDNIGHLMGTGRDGWGRAFCKGLEIAIGEGFDYVALIDTDILFMPPVRPIFSEMKARRQVFASCDGPPYSWIEGGIVFASTAWLWDVGFVGQYDWPNMHRGIFPEFRLADIAGSSLTKLELYGRRNDDGVINVGNIGDVAAIDWLTHCADIEVYKAFLIANGFSI